MKSYNSRRLTHALFEFSDSLDIKTQINWLKAISWFKPITAARHHTTEHFSSNYIGKNLIDEGAQGKTETIKPGEEKSY